MNLNTTLRRTPLHKFAPGPCAPLEISPTTSQVQADAVWTPSIPAGVPLSRTIQHHNYLAEHDGPNEWAGVQYKPGPPRKSHSLCAHMPSEREAEYRAVHRLRRYCPEQYVPPLRASGTITQTISAIRESPNHGLKVEQNETYQPYLPTKYWICKLESSRGLKTFGFSGIASPVSEKQIFMRRKMVAKNTLKGIWERSLFIGFLLHGHFIVLLGINTAETWVNGQLLRA
ncbi:hypothetical protein DFH08DRAFT_812573 [Mycena albidolilacea]|uniref:Uncharacterized protein n=1 Tax=Mycena albidolilacea TaxID=1033008 RepID=A0AAD6ZTP4_9AGAR|nr:hypothetical protein DFH08DRAFT_812573 [Mycena albidolilacea]